MISTRHRCSQLWSAEHREGLGAPQGERTSWLLRGFGIALALALSACGGEAAGSGATVDAAGSDGAATGFVAIEDATGCPTFSGSVGADGGAPPAALADYCVVAGDVWLIGEPGMPLDATQLAPLGNLRAIQGSLIVQGIASADLEALSRLETVGGDVTILDNYQLVSLTGLRSLRTVGHDLVIRGNTALVSLGTDALEAVQSGLLVEGNVSLERLVGLQKIEKLENALRIIDNDRLTDLVGLEGLREVGPGGVTISENIRLAGVDALERLASIGGPLVIRANRDLAKVRNLFDLGAASRVEIAENDNLTAIDTFPKLQKVTEVEIASCGKLEVVHGFSAIAKLEKLVVRDCAVLGKVVAFGKTAEMATVEIHDNDEVTDLDFAALVRVGTLDLRRNDSFASMAGFFTTKYITDFRICDNAKLSQAAIETFLKQLYEPPASIDDCKKTD